MNTFATDYLERIQFFNGQRLFATDLNELEAFHREMRELHNRSLHQPGVGKGYAVSGQRGDREVIIGPGYAIDDQGHEIVHAATDTESVPPVEGELDGSSVYYDLTVSYSGDDALEESETRQAVCCDTRGVVRLREEPLFCWVRLVRNSEGMLVARDSTLGDEIELGQRIRIARVEIKDCQIQSLSVSERRNARAATQPYVAAGKYQPCEDKKRNLLAAIAAARENLANKDTTGDEDSVVEIITQFRELVLCLRLELEQACVNTSSASFQTTPCYMAHVQWTSSTRSFPTPSAVLAVDLDLSALGFGWSVDVFAPKPNSFTARIIGAGRAIEFLDKILKLLSPSDSVKVEESADVADTPEVSLHFIVGIVDFFSFNIVWMGVE